MPAAARWPGARGNSERRGGSNQVPSGGGEKPVQAGAGSDGSAGPTERDGPALSNGPANLPGDRWRDATLRCAAGRSGGREVGGVEAGRGERGQGVPSKTQGSVGRKEAARPSQVHIPARESERPFLSLGKWERSGAF